jgi:hypothetical protein
MTEPAASTDISAALAGVLPSLRSARLLARVLLLATALATALAAFALRGRMGDDLDWLAFPLIAGFLVGALVFAQTSRNHDQKVMPHLARAIGLGYSKDAAAFLKALPPRLLPDRVRTAQDLLTGEVAGRRIDFAEVRVETEGKNARTLFRGFVIRVPNVVPMPPFFLGPASEFERGFLRAAKLSSEGLLELRRPRIGGQEFVLWSSSGDVENDAGLEAVLGVLQRLDAVVGGGATLYSVTSDREVMHLALRQMRDLFSIGGVFSHEETVMAAARSALEDLSIPVRITGAILDAEAKVVKRRGGA